MALPNSGRLAAIAAGLWVGFAALPAVAVEPLPDTDAMASDAIVVTARKIREPLIDVPGSVSVVTDRQMERAHIRSFADAIVATPNVAMSGGIAGQLQGQVAIRGISTLVRNIGIESGVGVYIDGVYIGRPDSYNQELLDVAQVEVLRGPQGTLFGRNTIAGVFNVISGSPTPELTAKGLLEAGNHGLFRAQATVSGPLAGTAADARLSIGYANQHGFDRHVSGGRDADSVDLFSWRGALGLHPSDSVTLTLRSDGLRDRGTPGFFSSTDLAFPGVPALPAHAIDNNRPNRLQRDIAGGSLTIGADLDGSELTGITAYRHSSYTAAVDDDQRQVDLLAADDFSDHTRVWSQELRLAGHAGDHLSYLAGVYFLDQSARTDRVLALGSALGIPGAPRLTTRGRVTTRSYAAFGSLDWKPIDRLTLSGGLRYTHERKRARFVQDDVTGIFTFLGLPDISFAGKSRDDDVSPTVSLSYAVTPDVKIYGRLARGFKSAAFNVDLATSPGGLTARPERATTYEAGLKASLAEHRVDLSLAAFHTAYNDLQVAQITGGGTVLSNAGKASIDGFEAELVARATDRLRIEGSIGYADAKYDRFDNCAVPLSQGGGAADCAGNRLTGAPRFTARAAAEYAQPLSFGSLSVRMEADHQSSVYFEPTNAVRFRGRAHTLVNARIGMETGKWSLSGWVRNLTKEVYETYRDDRSALGVLRTTAYGAPRTFGMTLIARM